MSDVRLKAMTMERVDTHSHWQPQQAELKGIAQGLGDFTQSPGMTFSRQLALGSQKLYGIDAGIFLRPDSPEELFEKAAALRANPECEYRFHLDLMDDAGTVPIGAGGVD